MRAGETGLLSRPWWQDVLLPQTDRVIAIQAIVVVVISAAAIALCWRWASVRLVVIGIVLIVVGLFGLRAAH